MLSKFDVSVVIPTRNRAKSLKRALHSLIFNQRALSSSYEIIVVDNGSSDNTKDIVDYYRKSFDNLQYIYEKKPGLHMGRHRGFKAATSEILAYLDDDIIAFPTFISSATEIFNNQKAVLAGGKVLPSFESAPPVWIVNMWSKGYVEDGHRVLGSLSLVDLGDQIKEISPFRVFGCNFITKKSIVRKANGFHPDGMPETKLFYRGDGETHISRFIAMQGLKTIYHPGASVYHVIPENRMTQEYFEHRSLRQGISDSYSDLRLNNLKMNLFLPYNRLKFEVKNIGKQSLKVTMRRAWWRGYLRHHIKVIFDQELRDWILKKDYID